MTFNGSAETFDFMFHSAVPEPPISSFGNGPGSNRFLETAHPAQIGNEALTSKAENLQLVIAQFQFACKQDLGRPLGRSQVSLINVWKRSLQSRHQLAARRICRRLVPHERAARIYDDTVTRDS